MEEKITISYLPISADKDKVFSKAKNDTRLIKAINEKIDKLKNSEVEIFHVEHNIIVTEQGYYGAFFESDQDRF